MSGSFGLRSAFELVAGVPRRAVFDNATEVGGHRVANPENPSNYDLGEQPLRSLREVEDWGMPF